MDTRAIQQRLIALGYDVGSSGADGVIGSRTEMAVRAFQAARGLAVDGVVGPRTIAALMAVDGAQKLVNGMVTSAAGRKAIEEREGIRLHAYQDSVGVWTVGIGHTAAAGPPSPHAGLTITADECDAILSRDLAKFEAAVLAAVSVPLQQFEFDALVSLAFNIGSGAFARSSVVKKLNARDRLGAAGAMLSWSKAKGKTLPGLLSRRQAERRQFLGM